VALVWASIGLPLACAYFVHVARTFRIDPARRIDAAQEAPGRSDSGPG
jgi:hypothetical protein